MRAILLLMLVLLVGCASMPQAQPAASWLRGEVRLTEPLPRPATVDVTILSVLEGRPLPVATMRYEVTMLPLSFALRLTPLQWGQGELYVRSHLYFVGERAIQASAQQKVIRAINSDDVLIQLQLRNCYPRCH